MLCLEERKEILHEFIVMDEKIYLDQKRLENDKEFRKILNDQEIRRKLGVIK